MKDPVAHVPVERLLGPDMDLHPEQLLEILNQPGVIHQTPAGFPGDQQIEVAILIGFTARNRPKHTQTVGSAPPGKPEDLLPPLRPQCVQGDHVSIVRQIRASSYRDSALSPPHIVYCERSRPAIHQRWEAERPASRIDRRAGRVPPLTTHRMQTAVPSEKCYLERESPPRSPIGMIGNPGGATSWNRT